VRYESLTEEEADLILHLSEDVLESVSTGSFTEEGIEDVFVAMMEAYDLSPDELEEAIEEFVEEDVLDERSKADAFRGGGQRLPRREKKAEPEPEPEPEKPKRKAKKVKRGMRGAEPEPEPDPKLKAAEKEPGEEPKKPEGDKKKGGLMQMLKNALVGAVKRIYKEPEKAGEIAKRGVGRFARKAKKHLARKGMKMVFGKWLKVGDSKGEKKPSVPEPGARAEKRREKRKERKKEQEESLALVSEVKSILDGEPLSESKRAEVERAWRKRGVVRMPPVDPAEYPPIRGMEGPFQFRDGRILYYDPRHGRYYDRKSDRYLSRSEGPM
jgi:hypothetical protein